jgi:hypothetical protein
MILSCCRECWRSRYLEQKAETGMRVVAVLLLHATSHAANLLTVW